MLRVAILSSPLFNDLVDEINDFLGNLRDSQLIDIKYNAGVGDDDHPSVLIIYKIKLNED